MRCYLFNRKTICYQAEHTAFIREIQQHKWVEEYYFYLALTWDYDGLIEEIEYDVENEQIISLSRMKGCWVDKCTIESYKPSEQVAEFITRTGITYEDIYLVETFSTFKDMCRLMPDLIEGAPGSEEFLKNLKLPDNSP